MAWLWRWLTTPGMSQLDRIAGRYGRPGEMDIMNARGETKRTVRHD